MRIDRKKRVSLDCMIPAFLGTIIITPPPSPSSSPYSFRHERVHCYMPSHIPTTPYTVSPFPVFSLAYDTP